MTLATRGSSFIVIEIRYIDHKLVIHRDDSMNDGLMEHMIF
jgi:hypothetical protein